MGWAGGSNAFDAQVPSPEHIEFSAFNVFLDLLVTRCWETFQAPRRVTPFTPKLELMPKPESRRNPHAFLCEGEGRRCLFVSYAIPTHVVHFVLCLCFNFSSPTRRIRFSVAHSGRIEHPTDEISAGKTQPFPQMKPHSGRGS